MYDLLTGLPKGEAGKKNSTGIKMHANILGPVKDRGDHNWFRWQRYEGEKGSLSRNCYCLSFYQHKWKVSANTKVSLLCSQVLEKTNDIVSSQTIMKTNECLEDLWGGKIYMCLLTHRRCGTAWKLNIRRGHAFDPIILFSLSSLTYALTFQRLG